MQQHMKGKGKIVDDPAEEARPACLDVLQAVNADAICILFRGNLPALGVFPWVAAQRAHGEPGVPKRQHRIIGQLGGGNIFGIKKLAQKQDIPFLFQSIRPLSLPKNQIVSVSRMDCSKVFTQ